MSFSSQCVLVFSILTLASSALAQGWDPDAYVDLLNQANITYDQALQSANDGERYELLFQSAQTRQEALELLRRALVSEDLADSESSLAQRDFFNLSENIMVILMQLDQCAAAELLLEDALNNPDILPEGGADHLASLRPDIEACEDRLWAAGPRWDSQLYETLVADAAGARSDAARVDGDPERVRSALYQSLQLEREALGILGRALNLGMIHRDARSDASEDLASLYRGTTTALLDLELCDAAQRQLDNAADDEAFLPPPGLDGLQDLQTDIDSCRAALAARLAAEREARLEQTLRATPVEEEDDDGVDFVPYLLLGVGGASFLSTVIYDVSLSSERDALDGLQTDCGQGPCNIENARTLAGTIDDGKLVVGVLGGIAITATATGLILLLTGEDASPEDATSDGDVAFTPFFGPTGAGLTVEY